MKKFPPNGPPVPQQQGVNVDLSQATDVTCDNCGNYTFQQVMLMKQISEILSPTGKAGIVPVPTFACNACGFVNEGFLPPQMRKTKEPPVAESKPSVSKIELIK